MGDWPAKYAPSNGTPSSWLRSRAPSSPKMWLLWLHFGHSKCDMFCTTPRTCDQSDRFLASGERRPADHAKARCRTGTSTFRNIATPLRASSRAMSCGVETMTAPAWRTRGAALAGGRWLQVVLVCAAGRGYSPEMGICWAIVNWVSPVPGGMSTTKMSRGAQATCAQPVGKATCMSPP